MRLFGKEFNFVLSNLDKIKIYVSAWTDGKNFGDDYLASAMFDYLKKNFAKRKFEVKPATLNIADIKLTENDIVIVAGGGLWGPSNTQCLEEHLYQIWNNCNAKLILANIGIESFNDKYGYQLKNIAQKAELISFRDRKSFEIATNIIKDEKIILGADTSYLNPIHIKTFPKNNVLGVNLCGPEVENNINNYNMEFIIDEINLLQESGYFVSATPFSYNDAYNDFVYCKKVDKSCKKRFSITPYKNCEIFLGMRFHSIIIALQNRIPTIAITYSDKVRRLMQEYDLNDFCIMPNELTKTLLLNKIQKIKRERTNILDRIKFGNSLQNNRINEFTKHLEELILNSN